MIDKPLYPKCPRCHTVGIDNLNMIISMITEQPLRYYRKLPKTIEISPDTSHNSAWINWDSEHANVICRNCGYCSGELDAFEDDDPIDDKGYADEMDS